MQVVRSSIASGRGASRCCATKSRTSRLRTTCWPRWKRSRCARAGRKARRDSDVRRARRVVINKAEGDKQQVIKQSEARRQRRQINKKPKARRRDPLARSRGDGRGIRQVAEAISKPGGMEALRLRVAGNYIVQFRRVGQNEHDDCADPARLRHGVDGGDRHARVPADVDAATDEKGSSDPGSSDPGLAPRSSRRAPARRITSNTTRRRARRPWPSGQGRRGPAAARPRTSASPRRPARFTAPEGCPFLCKTCGKQTRPKC